MTPSLIITLILAYFGLLLLVSYLTSLRSNEQSFYLGNRQAPWFIVSFGMIGATLSGVTFISVPGMIGKLDHINGQFSYFQVILGYILGYWVIASVLLPLYYRLNLTSIYGYLEERFGYFSRKTGAGFFLFSRVIGAAFRLFLVATVMQKFIFDPWGIPFWVTVSITILFIWVYTFKSGIKTIIYTDTLQTLFMLLAVFLTVGYVLSALDLNSISQIKEAMEAHGIKQAFFWDNSERNFFKQFLSGFFLAIVMTGLDQDMMQKNLSCRNIKDAQKNMYTLSVTMFFVNTLFVLFGALLYVYAQREGIEIPDNRDLLYPVLALDHFHQSIGILFILGLIAAAYSSADSALTSLTTSFVVDILDFERKGERPRLRLFVHIGFSLLLFLVIVVFRYAIDDSVLTALFRIAGLTYGPLLGLYLFGMAMKERRVNDKWVPIICVLSALLSYVLVQKAPEWFDMKIGFEILIYNGMLTFIGLLTASFFSRNEGR
jgi:Na+/proline symporter